MSLQALNGSDNLARTWLNFWTTRYIVREISQRVYNTLFLHGAPENGLLYLLR